MKKGNLTTQLYRLFESMKSFGVHKFELKNKALSKNKRFDFYFEKKIFAVSTFLAYKERAGKFVDWCSREYQIKELFEIKHSMFRDYINKELSRLKPAAAKVHLAACTKLGEGIHRSQSFHRVSEQAQRAMVDVPVAEQSRPTYTNLAQAELVQQRLVKLNFNHGVAMKLQMESGCRLVELDRLRQKDLLGIKLVDGKKHGFIRVTGKGGLVRQLMISTSLYRDLERIFYKDIKLIHYGAYRSAVYHASKSLGLKSGGTHKARRLSMQIQRKQIYDDLRAKGLTSKEASKEALQEINRQLGHGPTRLWITRLYLRS